MRNLLALALVAPSVCLSIGARTAFSVEPVGEPNRRVTINTISVYHGGGEAKGASTRVAIWYDRTPDQRIRLAFIEDEIDGFGDMWRAAAWQAALVAADLCGHDMAGTRLFLERSGRVDGPSAGAITTVGVLAALRGDTVRQDVAMTGTINPDGTIGPVGGIPQKIDGAAAAGIKTVLVPYGMRNDWDPNLKRSVDLVERGANKGVDVKLVGDIYTAYKWMTGKKLPRPEQAPEPILRNEVYRRFRIKVEEWTVKYQEQLAKYKEAPERYRSDYTDELVEEAAAWASDVKRLMDEGQGAAAYNNISDAALNVAIASETARTIWVDDKRGRKEAIIYAQRFARLPAKMRVATQKIRAYKTRSLGQVSTLIYSYAALTDAICRQDLAERMLDGRLKLPMFGEFESKDEEELERILEAVGYMQEAAQSCDIVEDNLDIAIDYEGRAVPENMPLAETADFFRRTARANLNQFEKSIIESKAEAQGISFEKMKVAMMVEDLDYLIAWWGINHAAARLDQLFEGESLQYAKLGLAIQTYSLSSSLMARNYSLGVEYDDDGGIKVIKRQVPLRFMLDFSEDQAKRNIQALRDADVDPSDVIFGYLAAGALRGGEPADRLYALQLLWEANIVARTVAYLGGFAGTFADPLNSTVPAAN